MTVKTEGEAGQGAGAAGAEGGADGADAFSTAFDEFALPEGSGKKDEAAGAEGAGAEGAAGAGAEGAAAGAEGAAAEGAAGAGAEGTAAGAEGAAAGAEGAGAEGAGAEGAAAGNEGAGAGAATPSADDILKGLTDLIAKGPAGAGAEGAAGAGAEGAGAGAGGEQQQLPELYNEEEKTFLESYGKDWGDVQKGEALIRRAEYRELLQHVFRQVADFVAPIKQTTDLLATRTHLTDIESAVPDYSDNLRDEVAKWVEGQPAYLHEAYNQVITSGTVDEVKDLVTRYREATGQKPAGGQEAPKPKGKDNELSGPAKQAAAALAPVESERSGVKAPGDPATFDDAWGQALKDLG